MCKTPLKTDSAENAPRGETEKVKIPRVSAQSEIFSGFRLSPQKLNNLFRMHYIGGRLFFYTTVAVSLLCETGQVRIRAESPAQGGKSGHFCQDRRETDSGGCRSGTLSRRVENQGAQYNSGLKNASRRRRNSAGKLTNPADFELSWGGTFR